MGGINISSNFSSTLDTVEVNTIGAKACGAMLKEKADALLDASQGLVPVDTGALKASGHVNEVEEGVHYQVIYDAPIDDPNSKWGSYALFLELGTSKMSAQPYLRPSIDLIKS